MKTIDDKLLTFLADAPLFFQPWWLEAVAPDGWDYVTVKRGEEVAAVLPFTFKWRLKHFRLIEMPPLTPYLGPWLRPSTAKYANRLAEEKDLMIELIAGLPKFAVFDQSFHPSITNWLPFFWQNFNQSSKYTYRMEETKNLDGLWNETRDNVRTDIKKAQKQLLVEDTDNIETFLRLHRLTFLRQGKTMPYSEQIVRDVHAACVANNAGKILIASGKDGQTHASAFLVTDSSTVYYFLGGANPELRNSGATSFVIWEAIRWASEQGRAFDFEGSMVESIERSFRSFGGRQVPYLSVTKCPSRIVSFYRTLWHATHR